MYQFDAERINRKKTVHLFILSVILLLGLGLVTLYSASYAFAAKFFNNGNYLIKRQLVFACIGFALFIFFSFIKPEYLRKFVFWFVGIAAALCALTLLPVIGSERYGASRWIQIGSFTYQPSEMVKFVLPLYLAYLLDKKKDNLGDLYTGILPPVVITGIFFALINFQNNFSTAVFIVFNVLVIFYLAGIKLRYFIAAIIMITPISILLIFTRTHRVRRLVSYLRPEWDPLKAGFQVNASRDAIISGGIFGKGIGQGTRKIANIPEIHSDFIFASYVEETGFIGILFFFLLFGFFAVMGYRIALKSKTVFDKLLAASLTTIIVSQVLLNVAVVSGALPATGIPLPFFSAGGSSLLTTLICAGLIANVARRNCQENAEANFFYYGEDDGND